MDAPRPIRDMSADSGYIVAPGGAQDRKEGVEMKRLLAALLVVALPACVSVAEAQAPGEVFRKVAPSVVVIRAKGRDISASGQSRFAETGSGVLISQDGKVMTAAHVVHAMDEISVEFLGGETVKAHVVASEPAADLSLLQLARVPAGAKASPLANSDPIQVGDPVIIVGAPYGLSYSLSNGLISARWKPNTVYKTMPLAEFFQTTATINTGNSGGPMFDMKGEVVGIVSHNMSKSGGSEGLGFVVTINTANKLLVERKVFWSALQGIVLTGDLAAIFNVPAPAGFLVKTVSQGSQAWNMGLQGGDRIVTVGGREIALGGDIILSVDGIPVVSEDNIEKIRNRLASAPLGTPFKMSVLRAGKVIELTGTPQ